MNKTKEIIFKIGDKVKIDVDAYTWNRHTYNNIFLNFIDNNKETVFTIKSLSSYNILSELEEAGEWLFPTQYLIPQNPIE